MAFRQCCYGFHPPCQTGPGVWLLRLVDATLHKLAVHHGNSRTWTGLFCESLCRFPGETQGRWPVAGAPLDLRPTKRNSQYLVTGPQRRAWRPMTRIICHCKTEGQPVGEPLGMVPLNVMQAILKRTSCKFTTCFNYIYVSRPQTVTILFRNKVFFRHLKVLLCRAQKTK